MDDHTSVSENILAGDSSNRFAKDYFIKTWFASNSNQILNHQKNTLAFKQLCYELDIKYLILNREHCPNNDYGRDLQHPGRQSYQLLAEGIYEEFFSQQSTATLSKDLTQDQ
jgi:hypothetical protein